MGYYSGKLMSMQAKAVSGIVTDGLKLYLDASNPASYPGSGTTWFDLSGNGNNGTMVNGVVPLSNAMQFDGVNDYVISNISNASYGSEFSIYMWVNMQGSQNGVGIWQAASNPSAINPWILCRRVTVGFRFYIDGDYGVDITVPNNTFFLMGLQFKNGIWEISVNGVVVQTQTKPIGGYAAPSLYLGNGYLGYFNGQINDTMIYSRVLAANEVNQIFNAQRSKYGI